MRRDSKRYMTRRNKYGNKLVRIGGYTFHSITEGNRWLYLQDQMHRGRITDLRRQVRFSLEAVDRVETAKHVGYYYADFVYNVNGNPCFTEDAGLEEGSYLFSDGTIVEDVKGVRTPEYILKKKIFEANYGRQLREIKAGKLTSDPRDLSDLNL